MNEQKAKFLASSSPLKKFKNIKVVGSSKDLNVKPQRSSEAKEKPADKKDDAFSITFNADVPKVSYVTKVDKELSYSSSDT